MHIRFSERERIDVCRCVQVGKTVVHESMCRFIGSNSVEDIEQFGIGAQAPVIDGNLGCRFILPVGSSAQVTARKMQQTIQEFDLLPDPGCSAY